MLGRGMVSFLGRCIRGPNSRIVRRDTLQSDPLRRSHIAIGRKLPSNLLLSHLPTPIITPGSS